MRASFITTVFNEGKTIKRFLDSLLNQSRKPVEVTIVDGGSTDNTIQKIKSYKKSFDKKKIKLNLLVKYGNRSVGRNEAIRNSREDIILCSDAGNILDKNWIENIVQPFRDNKIDIVSGFYKPVTETVFEKCLAAYTCVMEDKINEEDFLPSSRSVAFRKRAWESVHGYPENISTCEDLVFDKKLKEKGFKFKFAGKAIVFWPQRKNIFLAFKQFFIYAKGDGEALYFRPQTPFLFARYILGFYLLILLGLYRSKLLLILILISFILYIVWSISKNYKYVREKEALYILPSLQLVSDFAVLVGTTLGFIISISRFNFMSYLLKNKLLLSMLSVYIVIEIVTLNFGIPNKYHPFPYFMDEWHQLNAVRATIGKGSPNVEGSAHGTLFHFLLTGFYLIPFTLVKFINPVKIAIDDYINRGRIFELLRLNSIIYGVLTTFMLYKISKQIKTSFVVTLLLFTLTPLWLLLSGYFKYDIALLFWIVVSIFFIFKYANKPEPLNFIISAIPAGLAFAVKVSAVPLFAVYVFSYFWFDAARKKNIKYLISGILVYLFCAIIFGMPDVIFGKGNIFEYVYYNLVTGPGLDTNFIFPMDEHLYLLVRQYPLIFGYGTVLLFITSVVFWITSLFKKNVLIKKQEYKILTFLFISFLAFFLTLLPAGFYAGGNRSLVLLPFIVLIIGFVLKKISQASKYKLFVNIFIILAIIIQIFQCFSWLYTKLKVNPEVEASNWIVKNAPQKSIIGLENVPIYQYEPDIVQQEFYFNQYGLGKDNKFKYALITAKDSVFPNYILLTNAEIESASVKTSAKKSLYERIKKLGYKRIAVFTPDMKYFNIFSNSFDYYMSGNLISSPLIVSVFKK